MFRKRCDGPINSSDIYCRARGEKQKLSLFAAGDFRDFARNFMAEDERRLFQAVPFKDVSAAYAACAYLYEKFAGSNLRPRHFLEAHVAVRIILSYAHWR